ncbi:MAG: galactokinase, partial [Clostridia bacterium]|nr:galactokinase [Clostridia bacterium]
MTTIKELKSALSGGTYDAQLARMYCREEALLEPYRQRIISAADSFAEVFGKDDSARVCVCSAPGRTELGGNHTDHQHGKVLTASVDLDAIACSSINGTDTINIYSEGYGMISVSCNQTQPNPDEKYTTAALLRGIVAGIASRGYKPCGFDAYITSDVPSGSGLSSSACIEILLGVIINHLFCGDAIPMAELAKIGQYAENMHFGKPSGLLDQMGCAIGDMVAIDFGGEEPVYHSVDYSFAASGHAMCIIDSGGDHSDLTHEYSAIPYELHRVCEYFGKRYLREVCEDDFLAHLSDIRKIAGDRAVLRAMHVYAENERVSAQVEALERGDFDAFLTLTTQSGLSSWRYMQNVSAAGETMHQEVALALAITEKLLGGRGSCRVHGGGFAGAIQAFVPLDMLDSFRQDI